MEFDQTPSQTALAPNGPQPELGDHIRGRLRGRVRDFRLIVREGGLILQGRAATYYAKQLAQHAAMEISRMPILANEISVT